MSMKEIQREAIVAALTASHGHIPRAAASLGMAKMTIHRKIETWEIDPSEYGGCGWAAEDATKARIAKATRRRQELVEQFGRALKGAA